MKKVFSRMKEPSTWAGLAALSVLFGVDPEKANAVVQGVGVLAGAVAVLLPEVKAALPQAGE